MIHAKHLLKNLNIHEIIPDHEDCVLGDNKTRSTNWRDPSANDSRSSPNFKNQIEKNATIWYYRTRNSDLKRADCPVTRTLNRPLEGMLLDRLRTTKIQQN